MFKALLGLFLFSGLLPAATIFSGTTGSTGIFGGTIAAAGMSVNSTWNNVTITMDLGSNNGAGSSATVFLTTQIGPGTTVANQLATAVISVPSGVSTRTLFSGLTFTPGNYFFTVVPADSLTGPVGGGVGSFAVGPGVTNPVLFTMGAAAYAPAGATSPATFGMRFLVAGDQVGVPEPGTSVLLAAGAALLAVFHRRRIRN